MKTNERANAQTWPDLAIGLYDRLTGRNAEINYEMENLTVEVPASAEPGAARATWMLNGSLRVSTRERGAE